MGLRLRRTMYQPLPATISNTNVDGSGTGEKPRKIPVPLLKSENDPIVQFGFEMLLKMPLNDPEASERICHWRLDIQNAFDPFGSRPAPSSPKFSETEDVPPKELVPPFNVIRSKFVPAPVVVSEASSQS